MTPRTRWSLLLTLLAGSAALVLFDDRPSSGGPLPIVEPSRVSTAARLPASRSPSDAQDGDVSGTMILELRRRTPAATGGQAFASRDWTPPPPPPPPAPPVRPMAPPLPFTYVGKQFTDGAWSVFLSGQGRTRVVLQGEVIDDTYRVESITPPLMILTYLPLKQSQNFSIGANP